MYNFTYLFTFGRAGSSLLHRLFFSWGEQKLLSGCSAQASLVAELRLEGLRASVVAVPRLLTHRFSRCGAHA